MVHLQFLTMSSSMNTPNRRQTLGPVPNNTVNHRKSIGPNADGSKQHGRPPRASMIPRVGRENTLPVVPPSPSVTASTATSRRKSIAVTENRRQSMLIPPGGSGVSNNNSNSGGTKDLRPINEKVFQQQCMKQILTYLHESGYEYPITMKTLAKPSGKDFNSIITFLLRRIDPGFQDGTMKFEDEVALNFKGLGYPFQISRTALVAAGTPHTWPTLLAALSWLVERLMVSAPLYRQTVDDDTKGFETLEELEIRSDRIFFQYLGDAYQAFLYEDTFKTEQLEATLSERFERDDAFLEQEIDRLTDLNATIVKRISDLKSETEGLTAFNKKKEDYITDLAQFHDLLRQMEHHKATLETKVKERTEELAKINEILMRNNKQLEELQSTVKKQKVSVDGLRKLENEIKGVTEATERALKLKSERQTALSELQNQLKTCLYEIEGTVTEYNHQIASVMLHVPKLLSQESNCKVKCNKDNRMLESPEAILGLNVTKQLYPLIKQTRDELKQKVHVVKSDHQDALDQLEKTTNQCEEENESLKILQEKVSKCETGLKQDSEAHKAKLAVRQREVDDLESKIATLHDPVAVEEQIASFESQCAYIEVCKRKYQDDCLTHRNRVLNEIVLATDLMREHKNYWAQTQEAMQKYCENSRRKVSGTLSLPSNVEAD